MADPITRAQVERIAGLARLALSEEELDRFTRQLATILSHFEAIAAVDTGGVPPTVQPVTLTNVLRDDEVEPGCDRDEVLGEAPDVEGPFVRVPRIREEEA